MKLTSSDKRFALLRPVVSAPRLDQLWLADSVVDLDNYLNDIPEAEMAVAIDFETRGNVPAHPDFRVVGMGLSCSIGSIYIHMAEMNEQQIKDILVRVNFLPLVAHNLYFDYSVLYKYDIECTNILACTLILYKQLANEGFLGQSWSLASAQRDQLGWIVSNKDEVAEWLSRNGYTKSNVSKAILEKVNKGEALTETEYDKLIKAADKSQLYQVPKDILSKYCCLDADSTWQLYTLVLKPALDRIPPQTWMVHQEAFLPLVYALVDNHFKGMTADKEDMAARLVEIQKDIGEVTASLRDFPGLKEFIAAKEARWIEEIPVPPQFKKDGKLSKNYENYLKKIEEIRAGTNEKLNKEFKFNVNGDELGEYIYEHYLTFDVIKEHMTDARGRIRITGGGGKIGAELDMTESGKLPTNKDAYPVLGELGTLLAKISKLQKLEGYVKAGLAKLDECGDGIAHPQYRLHGTLTGRLAGGGDSELKANYQQMPSDEKYLACYQAPPGFVLLQADFCLHPKTELLTRRGWINVMEIMDSDEVWQVNKETLAGSWTKPSRLVKRHYEGNLITVGNKRGSFSVTENHTMLYVGQYHNKRKDKERLRWVNKSQEEIPSSGCNLLVGSEYPATPSESHWSEQDIWTACMLQADGNLVRAHTHKYRVQVAVPKKREKIRAMLGREGSIAYRVQNGKAKLPTEQWYITFNHPLLTGKTLNVDLIGDNQLDLFLEALSFWDSSIDRAGRILFSSTDKKLVDRLQIFFVTKGYEAKIELSKKANEKHKACWKLNISKGVRVRLRKIDKTSEFYSGPVGCVTVADGFILIRSEGQTFVTGNCALEPHALAELSRSKRYLELYGPGAKKHDIYLFNGMHLKQFRQKVLDSGYDPDNSVSVETAKGLLKKERDIFKVLTLSSSYGAGPGKIFATLKMKGVDITFEEVQQIHSDYWGPELYGDVKDFERDLMREWKENSGWVLDGLGCVVCVDDKYKKDMVNRVIQRTGHSILLLFLFKFLEPKLKSNGIKFHWYIPDLHDETIYAVEKSQAHRAMELHREAVDELNAWLGGVTMHEMDPKLINNLAERKLDEKDITIDLEEEANN